jgi:DNA processing protein
VDTPSDEPATEILHLGDAAYPHALRHTFDPPSVLYVRGRLAPEDAQAVAVVGSRHASAYGLAAAEAIARDLASAGVTVVSGLAIGIDSSAHRGALAAGGRTIAVLGCGIDRIYPARNEKLAREIVEHGAVLSEFSPGTPPDAWRFPRRNRIVAGLSLGAVIVEAGDKSGSLITARLALENGREVFAVPGEIGLARTRGTHRLLREGAKLVECGADVLEEVAPWLSPSAGLSRKGPDEGAPHDAKVLLDAFDGAVVHVDRLIAKSGLGAARTLEILLDLELSGLVRQHPGMLYSRRPG